MRNAIQRSERVHRYTNASGTSRARYFTYNLHGDLTQALDEAGNIAEIGAFNAHGAPLRDGAGVLAVSGMFGYGAKFGYVRDGESGFYLCGFRYYDPSSGRWVTRDPIGYAGGQNLCGYVGNDPVNAVDPSGLARVEVHFRPISGLPTGTAYHAFVQVWENGGRTSFIFRAGPAGTPGRGASSGASGAASTSQSSGERSYGSGSSNSSNSSSPGAGPGGAGQPCGPWGPITPESRPWARSIERTGTPILPAFLLIVSDNRPAQYYIDKFNKVAVSVAAANIPYNPFTTNSNAYVTEVLVNSGVSPNARSINTPGRAPGWSTNLPGGK